MTLNSEHPIDVGRLNVIRKLSNNGYGLNVGCGRTRFANKANIDITRKKSDPDVVATVFNLPFPDNSFDEIIFADTIEHLPWDSTLYQALEELRRVLKPKGKLIVSTPNDTVLCKLLDPIWWIHRHKHINPIGMWGLLFLAHFSTNKIKTFTAGKLPFGVVTLTYALNYVLRRKKVDLFGKIVERAYNGSIGNSGGTTYGVAIK